MIEIPFIGQSPVSALDHTKKLLCFDFLTRKKTELDFNAFIPNVDLFLASKWYKDHLDPIIVAQDITEIRRCVKTVFTCISSFEYFTLHVFLKHFKS